MFRPSDLEAYLNEELPPEEMARIEKTVREDRATARQLAEIHARRNTGVHSLGEIWRRHRLSCPSREQLGGFLLGAIPESLAGYIAFHVEEVGCRYCRANLIDLQSQHVAAGPDTNARRRKIFQSTANYLRTKPNIQ